MTYNIPYSIDPLNAILVATQNLWGHSKKWLLKSDPLSARKGRGGEDRRSGVDQRLEENKMRRLRQGFWDSYARVTRKGEQEEINIYSTDFLRMGNALKGEAKKYNFTKKSYAGQQVSSDQALEHAVYAVQAAMSSKIKERAYYLVSTIVEKLDEIFVVTALDRRFRERRREWRAAVVPAEKSLSSGLGNAVPVNV